MLLKDGGGDGGLAGLHNENPSKGVGGKCGIALPPHAPMGSELGLGSGLWGADTMNGYEIPTSFPENPQEQTQIAEQKKK